MDKKKLLFTVIIALVFLLGNISGILFFSAGYNDILDSELSNYSSGKSLVKIDGESIGEDYLNKRVELYKKYILKRVKSTDPLVKDKVLKKLIDNYIVLSAADKTGIFSTEKSKSYLWIYLEEAMVNYYLDFLVDMRSNKKFLLSDKQINDFYLKNKKSFDSKKISKEKAILQIKNSLKSMDKNLIRKNSLFLRKIELGKLKKDKEIKIDR